MKPIRTSKKEIIDLTKSLIAIAIAFTLVLVGPELTSRFLTVFIISIITVGLGFILHELAHKLVAQRYKCWAEFRSQDSMLFMAILIAFAGFLFAAPGAVLIFGNITKRQNGIISLAGPLTNIIIALLFIPLLFTNSIYALIGMIGFTINSWLALFNLIPFQPFDGKKIFDWNKTVYIAMAAVSLILVFGKNFI